MMVVAGLCIQWKMVHQLNVILIMKMDTPAVLLLDGVEIHRLIVHVAIALITVKVNFEKNSFFLKVGHFEIFFKKKSFIPMKISQSSKK